MAQYGTVTVNIQTDLSEFRKSLRRVLNAVEELDTALKELNTTPIKMTTAEPTQGASVVASEVGWTLRNHA